MSFDANMPGPAQRYSVYGLQAAHEASDERAHVRAAGLLVDLAYQMRALGDPKSGLRLAELALERIPLDRHRFNTVRAMVWSIKAHMLSPMGIGHLSEMRNAVNLSFDLHHDGQAGEYSSAVAEYWPYTSEAELASVAAISYADLAVDEPRLAVASERYAEQALAHRAAGFDRSRVFDQISLARARFLACEPDQASADGTMAIEMSADVAASRRVATRLRELMIDSEPYRDRLVVRDFHERLRVATEVSS
jgi:hypothetical protein